MTIQSAALIQNGMAVSLLLIWAIAAGLVWNAFRHLRTARRVHNDHHRLDAALDIDEDEELRTESLATEIDPEVLSSKAAAALSAGGFGTVCAKHMQDKCFAFIRDGASGGKSSEPHLRGLLEIIPREGGRTQVLGTFAVERPSPSMLSMAAGCLTLGLCFIVGGYFAIQGLIAQSPDSAVVYLTGKLLITLTLLCIALAIVARYSRLKKLGDQLVNAAASTLVIGLTHTEPTAVPMTAGVESAGVVAASGVKPDKSRTKAKKATQSPPPGKAKSTTRNSKLAIEIQPSTRQEVIGDPENPVSKSTEPFAPIEATSVNSLDLTLEPTALEAQSDTVETSASEPTTALEPQNAPPSNEGPQQLDQEVFATDLAAEAVEEDSQTMDINPSIDRKSAVAEESAADASLNDLVTPNPGAIIEEPCPTQVESISKASS